MPDHSSDQPFFFIANYSCLDFINTQIAESGRPVDLLKSFGDLVFWCVQARVLETTQQQELFRQWRGRRDADQTFARAIEFRAALRQMAERIVAGKTPAQVTIARINELLQHQVGHAELRRAKGGFEKHFQADFKEPIHLLWPWRSRHAISSLTEILLSSRNARTPRACSCSMTRQRMIAVAGVV